MRKDTLFKRFEVFVAAATIAAHANYPREGFRQREVRFLIELFSNWASSGAGGLAASSDVLELSNTQVSRYLENLVTEGNARRSARGRWPYYRLTRVGLIELVARLVDQPLVTVPAHFFFVYYFISNYGPRITELVKVEGKQFPVALALELQGLLDIKSLVQRQIKLADRELQQLEIKSGDSVKGAKLAARLYAQGLDHLSVAAELEKQYPYQLNSQKPLSKLIADIPADIGRWEIEIGGMRRAEQIFMPTRAVLLAYVQQLKRLADVC